MGSCLIADFGGKVDLAHGEENFIVIHHWQLGVIVEELETIHLHCLAILQ